MRERKADAENMGALTDFFVFFVCVSFVFCIFSPVFLWFALFYLSLFLFCFVSLLFPIVCREYKVFQKLLDDLTTGV